MKKPFFRMIMHLVKRKAYKIHDRANKPKKMHEKAPSTKEDLLTVIWESWNHFDKKKRYCFKLAEYMPERITIVIKT